MTSALKRFEGSELTRPTVKKAYGELDEESALLDEGKRRFGIDS